MNIDYSYLSMAIDKVHGDENLAECLCQQESCICIQHKEYELQNLISLDFLD